ncbi:MAG: ATP-binding cassette domain-containing protein [Verrucomicrobiales bacterium]|nr:ATP-binding cassette domain-containing protein [Verrucomicrobiae bacterium]MCP5554895.1 ATP-binding cassette domain-containing protein [Akkermansiaceae bacterium]
MIHVENLTKRYAGKTAIDRVTFDVGRGEIVGFLGPNGAGKSTTLKILTCYLSATAGSAKIAGHDIFTDSVRARQHIGYMPENVPLYTDMRVAEYLNFRARLKGLRGRDATLGAEEAMETTGLSGVSSKMIASLSKGYRQRVGLADALVNKPDLLILDEPTNGLDPNQIRQVRELIKQLGDRHTILISTHILSEVEVTCGRVIIINHGHIKASDTPQNLIRRLGAAGKTVIEVKTAPNLVLEELEKMPGVESASHVMSRGDWTVVEIATEPNIDLREALHELMIDRKWPLRELTRRTASLEDAFVGLTKSLDEERAESH